LIPAGAALVAVLVLAEQAPDAVAPPGSGRDRAIAALHARAAMATLGTRDAARLSGELERIGAAYLAEGDLGRSTELLSEAYALDEENGLVLAELTLCYVRAGDLDFAQFYLRRAQERVSRAPAEIYAVLGDAYLGLHRLDDAVLAWSEFFRFGGIDPALLARLARAKDELAVSRGQRSLAFDHFTIFADAGVSEDLVRRAGGDLEAAYAEQAPLLGARLEQPQIVILYSGRAYFSLASAPDWASGAFDGKIRVSVEPDASAGSSASVLAHELAHALVRASSGDRVPGWFHEGLAQWCEGRRLPVREARAALGTHAAASIVGLEETFGRRVGRSAARASYAQALSLVEFLVAVRGVGAVACILHRLGEKGGQFEEALRAETGLSGAELFAGWKSWAGL
jgi:tetratricopeptide (TPR) repeat protein